MTDNEKIILNALRNPEKRKKIFDYLQSLPNTLKEVVESEAEE